MRARATDRSSHVEITNAQALRRSAVFFCNFSFGQAKEKLIQKNQNLRLSRIEANTQCNQKIPVKRGGEIFLQLILQCVKKFEQGFLSFG